MHCAVSYGESGSKSSRRKSYGYHRIENNIIYPEESNFKEHKNKGSSREKGAKRSTNLARALVDKLKFAQIIGDKSVINFII